MRSWRLLLFGLLCTCARPIFAEAPSPADPADRLVRPDAGGPRRPAGASADRVRPREQILTGMQQVMGPLPAHLETPGAIRLPV